MSGYSLAGLFSAFSGTDTGTGYKSLSFDHFRSRATDGHRQGHSRHGHSVHDGREKPAAENSFQISLSKVGRSYLQSNVAGTEQTTEETPAEEQEFALFRNHGQQRRAQAFLDNLLRKLVSVFAIKILGDFLGALKDGASLDQLALDESQTDIGEATENEQSVVTVEEPAEQEDTPAAPSLATLSISVGLQIDITIGQLSQDGGVLSSQTVEADNPLVSDQTATNLVA
ncbi:hypothetical protein [Emcibacter nanhaiensis]|uniref:Uncharacterized protein n=1 Tax=Emcibacter nanhaiensis TaxID=1505037 RepID=A0A501PNJ9_9PROT|nr:hypothetical protein [Emcibacter nanhaiensis]TPD61544.1 hypothetical protein FIV46_04870 [Emcibacter nanhaiensis]